MNTLSSKTLSLGVGIFIFTILALFGVWKLLSTSDTKKPTEKVQSITIEADDHVKGNKNANLILVEYSDFQCPACQSYQPVISQLIAELKNELQFVYRHYPLPQHKNADKAALAAEAASLQGKFWEMHDKLFQSQKDWADNNNVDVIFTSFAKNLKLDTAQFKKDMTSATVSDRVNRDKESGNKIGVNSTPSFYLNGVKIANPQSFEEFKKIVQEQIKKNPSKPTITGATEAKIHLHANFKIYVNGKAVEFSNEKYQSVKGKKELSDETHLHDLNGDVIHVHKKDVTFGYFLKTLNFNLNKNCLITDNNEKYCTDKNNSLIFYVNGKNNEQYDSYIINDLDRLMLSYGPKNDSGLKEKLNAVTDTACIYSEKCPERGKAPTEECVGGLGSEC